MDINKLIELIDSLRGENGCPWDQRQTPRTMAAYLLEEVYELIDAIETEKSDKICEEIGDVIFQLVFIALLYQEMGDFNFRNIIDQNVEKMIRRHPHVFGRQTLENATEVKHQWHKIKNQENEDEKLSSVLDSIPAKLPALMRAYRISDRASGQGFDWEDITGVIKKVEEEWHEFRSELYKTDEDDTNQDRTALEFGDLLFTLVNVARFAHIHPEMALMDSIRKFEKRFRHMEKELTEEDKALDSLSPDAIDTLWEAAKKAVG